MQKLEILVALLHLHNIEFSTFDINELKAWLHSLRTVTREIEREIIVRDRGCVSESSLSLYFNHMN
jgi:hypothetical protein